MNVSIFSARVGVIILAAILLLAVNLPSATATSNHNPTRVLIAFDGPVDQADRALVEAFGGDIRYSYNLIDAVAATVPEAAITGLERHPLISRVEMDGTVEMLSTEYEDTWSVGQIEADTVHDDTINPVSTGDGVKIGIIDSGTNYFHPDLVSSFDSSNLGYDFYNYDHDPMDMYGHGTHVSGTACAPANGFGVVGVAPDCELYSLRVHSDDGVAYWSDIMAAVDYATGEPIDLSDPKYWDTDVGAPTTTVQGPKLDIINLSLGKEAHPGEIVQGAFDAAYYEHDLLIVAAAGNSGNRGGNNDSIIYPAKFDSVIAVGATDSKNQRASWSSTGPALEIVAPGDGVYSTWNDEESYANPQPVCTGELVDINGDGERDGECYKYGAGTSMASPHVAGVAALMIAADKAANGGARTLGAAQLRLILSNTATVLGNANEYGNGLVNAVAAVNAALNDGGSDPVNQAPTADAGGDQTVTLESGSETISVTLVGSGSLDLDGQIVSHEWISDTGVTASGETVVVTLGEGAHIFTLTVTDDDGAMATDQVSVTVEPADDGGTIKCNPGRLKRGDC